MVGGGVDLGVETGVTDEVDNPTLSSLLVHVQLLSQHGNVDLLVDSAVSLEDAEASVLHELVAARAKEEVVGQHTLTLAELDLGGLKVEVDVQVLQEGGDGITVCVALLLKNLHQIL